MTDKSTDISIFGYFTTDTEAEQAALELREAGIEDVEVDRISKYPGDDTDILRNPLTGQVRSLAELTLGVESPDVNKNILSAADPSASGMGSAEDAIQERAYMVAVVCPHTSLDKARQILESNGGLV